MFLVPLKHKMLFETFSNDSGEHDHQWIVMLEIMREREKKNCSKLNKCKIAFNFLKWTEMEKYLNVMLIYVLTKICIIL